MKTLLLALVLAGNVITTATPNASVAAGSSFLIALPANPTTGYAWTARVSGDGITAEGSAYQAQPAAPGVAGSGGQQVFSFDARRVGRTTITFAYSRPWEKHVAPARISVFHITVK